MFAQLILAGALAAGIAAAGAGLYLEGKRSGRNDCIATAALIKDAATKAADSAASAAAVAISKIKVRNTTITSEVQREVSERLVYRDCLHSPVQLQRINSALTGSGPEPVGRSLVPRADAIDGPVLRRDNAQAGGGGGSIPRVP